MPTKSSSKTASTKKRLAIIFMIAMAALVLLIVQLAHWMLIDAGMLQEKAAQSQTKRISVSAQRGNITDRNGDILATSASAYTVVLRPKEIKDAGEVADLLSPILGIEVNTIYKKANDKTKYESWLKRQITDEQYKAIDSLDLPGVAFISDTKRYYTSNAFLTQTLGYTTIDGVGQEGIEKKYDKYLAGVTGQVVAEADGKSRLVADTQEIYIEAEDGYNVEMTIDRVIQNSLEKACEDALAANSAKGVWGIVMDPNTAEILAITVQPDYDLNEVPRSDTAALAELSRNKIITDAYEPGSTFKIITGASALDSGSITMESTFNCVGYKIVNGEKIKCWRSYRPHGAQNIYQAFANSCNPCFMEMALAMGVDKYYEYLYSFGFGENTGIDFSTDGAGIVRHKKYIKDTDLARIGFGQSIAVTPLQLITAVSAVINGGDLYTPMLVRRITDADGNVVATYEPTKKRSVISAETSKNMRNLLKYVVSDGSGANAQIPGYSVGGKTGTAQKYGEDGSIAQGKTMGSFIGFAPADDPKYICIIIVDEPGVAVDFGSVVAAPFVKEVLEDTLKYAGIDPDEQLKAEDAKVPDVVGKSIEDAKIALAEAGFKSEADGIGTVRSQTPAADSYVAKGSTILLSMSNKSGAEDDRLIEVPDLADKTIVGALKSLQSAGLKIEVVGSGKVVSQNPKAGTKVGIGTTVTVTCGGEPNPTSTPKPTGTAKPSGTAKPTATVKPKPTATTNG